MLRVLDPATRMNLAVRGYSWRARWGARKLPIRYLEFVGRPSF